MLWCSLLQGSVEVTPGWKEQTRSDAHTHPHLPQVQSTSKSKLESAIIPSLKKRLCAVRYETRCSVKE
jgi:hypothetical protein